MASIIIMTGNQKGNYFPLGRRTNVIGRDEALPIQILDERVSRKHLQIRFYADQQKYYADDLNSKHGVFINSEKINTPTELTENDIITIGATSILFTLNDFANRENALSHFKKIGERIRGTIVD